MNAQEIVVPEIVFSLKDLTRILRELEQLDAGYLEASARAKIGAKVDYAPMLSVALEDFLAANPVDISVLSQRSRLIDSVRQLKQQAPLTHLTFAVVPDMESLIKISRWLRENVHPQMLIRVGLQPDLVGGVYVRTTNRALDLSLRAQLANHRHVIAQELEALCGR